jgi:tRNA(His) guanylyltransferase
VQDEFGDRMKLYEQAEAGRQLMPTLPALARLDGRTFHTFTRHAKRPFSAKLHAIMVDVTRHLVEESGALVGYTQSDEISLAWHSTDVKSQIFFDGNVQKMVSTLAALASVRFNEHARDPDAIQTGLAWHMRPTFDCRIWNVPTLVEAANVFVWRQADASRNSVSMAARAHFSHKAVDRLSCKQMQEKLMTEAGVNWSDYPDAFKNGTFVRRKRVTRAFTAEEIEKLPPQHEARRNPDLVVERWQIEEVGMRLVQLADREVALFAGADVPVQRNDA